MYEAFKDFLKKAGLPNIRFHDLRHTAATMPLGMMTNPRIAREILGHSTISITMDAYSHFLPLRYKEAMNNIKEWLISYIESQKKDQTEIQKALDDEENDKEDDDNDEGQGSGALVPV